MLRSFALRCAEQQSALETGFLNQRLFFGQELAKMTNVMHNEFTDLKASGVAEFRALRTELREQARENQIFIREEFDRQRQLNIHDAPRLG
jgi:hypothetical protein